MIQVEWDEEMCIHSGRCVKALPQVFRVDEKGNFTIDAAGADAAAIRRAVEDCPSGALRVRES